MTGPPASCQLIAPDVRLGRDVRIFGVVNLYGCEIGDDTKIGCFVQKGAKSGLRCKTFSPSFICEGVEIKEAVFIGPGVTFINDRHPKAKLPSGRLQIDSDWHGQRSIVKRGASIDSRATLLGGIIVGENAPVPAISAVTRTSLPVSPWPATRRNR